MSLTTDKRKANYIIACGYCLVVIIILFNYLRTPRNNYFREGTRAAHSNQALDNANKELENQLKEQKRMNKEMREMLIDIHNNKSINEDKTINLSQTSESLSSENNAGVFPKTVKEVNAKAFEMPDLNSDVNTKFKHNPVYPFDADKNPFALSEAIAETIDNEDNLTFHGQTVICDPILPYMFSSSNSSFKLISNY